MLGERGLLRLRDIKTELTRIGYTQKLADVDKKIYEVQKNLTELYPNLHIATPQGKAFQSSSAKAIKLREKVNDGITLFKGGVLEKSKVIESQYWSTTNPLSKDFAHKFGIPEKNVQFDFVLQGKLKESSRFITREAPGVGKNLGGEIEVVVKPNSIEFISFYNK